MQGRGPLWGGFGGSASARPQGGQVVLGKPRDGCLPTLAFLVRTRLIREPRRNKNPWKRSNRRHSEAERWETGA